MESDRKKPTKPPVAEADEDPNVEGGYASPPCFLHEVEAGPRPEDRPQRPGSRRHSRS